MADINQSVAWPGHINNWPPASEIFHGRQFTLDKMQQYFSEDSGKQRIYVLYGLGGAGKTQIALKFVESSLSQYVCCIGTVSNLQLYSLASPTYFSSTPAPFRQLMQVSRT